VAGESSFTIHPELIPVMSTTIESSLKPMQQSEQDFPTTYFA
jgi:hypothetical protein